MKFRQKKSVVSRKGEFYEDNKIVMSSGTPLEELRCVCGNKMKMLFALEVCSVCGITRQYIDATIANVSYGDKPPKISESGSQRIKHLNEWLSQIQAKESTSDEEFSDKYKKYKNVKWQANEFVKWVCDVKASNGNTIQSSN